MVGLLGYFHLSILSYIWWISWVSEWMLFNANSAIFQLYHGDNKLIFIEMMMRSALYQTNTLSWICIVLAQGNNSPRVDMSLHSNTLFWFRANQPLLLLFNDACLAEKQHIPLLVFGLTRPGLEHSIYRTRDEHAKHYATYAVILKWPWFFTIFI
jgi:hypothetical protein